MPTNVSGGYRTYESNNNLFADASSAIYTLIEDNTTKTLVDLASFNQKLIPFQFVIDSINFIVIMIFLTIMERQAHENTKSGDMKTKYYDFVFDTNTYYVYYNITKYEGGLLTSDVLGVRFKHRMIHHLIRLVGNLHLMLRIIYKQKRLLLFIKALCHIYKRHIIFRKQMKTLQIITSGVSDLKMNRFMTSYYVDICGSDFAWKTNDISNSISDPFISDAVI